MKKIVVILRAFFHMGGRPEQLVCEGFKLAVDSDYRNDWYETIANNENQIAA